MSDEVGEAVAAVEPKPRIVIEFAGRLSAEITLRAELVSPGQVYLAAWLLEATARELRAGQLQPVAGLVVPAGVLTGNGPRQ